MELTEDTIRQIERVHSSWIQLEAAGQNTRLLDLCGDEIEFQPPDGPPIIGREAIMAWLGGGKDNIQSLEISDRRVRGTNEIAYLTASYRTVLAPANDKKTRQTSGSHLWILQNRAGKWLITLVTWSRWD
jgi:ketosteroid isomerase-like protein